MSTIGRRKWWHRTGHLIFPICFLIQTIWGREIRIYDFRSKYIKILVFFCLSKSKSGGINSHPRMP